MNDAPSDLEAAYYGDLNRFVDLCGSLTAAGQPYLTVLLSHELYRFLYPAEPYAGFTHDDPVPFLASHIRRLISFGTAARETVRGYPQPAQGGNSLTEGPEKQSSLERETSDLYSDLWLGLRCAGFHGREPASLTRRIPEPSIEEHIVGKSVLDLGCGSGRYSVALAGLGAASVTAVDFQAKSYRRAEEYCKSVASRPLCRSRRACAPLRGPLVRFCLFQRRPAPYSLLGELRRGIRSRDAGSGFLFLYATGGFFWATRRGCGPCLRPFPEPIRRRSSN